MFALNPDGGSGSNSSESDFKKAVKFFGKIGLYFVAIRSAYVFLGADAEDKTSKTA